MRHRAATVVFINLLLLFATGAARAQFSPGPLSKAHSSLQGPTHCTSCHVAAGGTRRFKCLGCHVEIRQRLAANRGLHPSLLGASRGEDKCVSCHSEHNGENFVPIRWDVDLSDFDHRKTGYALDGRHAKVDCRRCHAPEHIDAAARRGITVKDVKRTWLGLSRACASCHEDEHRGQLGGTCERCHTTSGWRDVQRFDHQAAKFKLVGAHARVACAKCHARTTVEGRPRPMVKFTGLPFAQCTACHQDPHRAAFAAPCSSCHGEAAWKPARDLSAAFDHSKTHFPLAGKHAALGCDKCHKDAKFKTPVAHERCADCHRDRHNGQFLARADKGECGSCHTVDGWKPSTFTVAAHGATAYPLAGRHAAVACAKCHVPAGAATVYHQKHEACANCHRDPHDAQFAAVRCEQCHTVERFRPAAFTLARHNRTLFPLEGAHLAVPCGECHKPGGPGRASPAVYRFADLSCTSCHTDPHKGQFRIRMASTANNRGAGCLGCHTVRSWRDVGKFDHSGTSFPLTGAHRGAGCEQCHRSPDLAGGMRYAKTPSNCGGCHEDVHGGQFAARAGEAGCAACHITNKWRPAGFDHERTAFSLTGAHQGVSCKACHKNLREVGGRAVLFFKPTPKECSSCHGREISD